MDESIADQVVVVVPTIREASIREFLTAWQWPCQVIIVEDNPEKTFGIEGADHYAWPDIERDLGTDSWIIPRRTDCIRSYGIWKAWQTGKPYIITLDDDCFPIIDRDHPGGYVAAYAFLRQHLNNLQPHVVDRWHNTIGGVYPRGYPYEQRESTIEVGISHGLWTGVPDFDSLAQLQYRRAGSPEIEYIEGIVPRGQYYPMCGMNLAWRREYTPLMYFLLMGHNPQQGHAWPFDRFGDIWAGIISKKVLDHLGVGVWSGAPYVRHARASNVWANYRKEHAGIAANEVFWRAVDAATLTSSDIRQCYKRIAVALFAVALFAGGDRYWSTLEQAMHTWSALYE